MEFDSQKLLELAVAAYLEKKKTTKLDITNLAERCGLSYSNVYQPLLNKRKPNADIWLKLMKGLGAVQNTRWGFHIRF